MKTYLRVAFLCAAAVTAIGVGTDSAQATPPIPVPEPGGIIRMDLAPGEWWSCDGISLAPPFWQLSPVVLGPSPLYLRFAPGADVWVRCSGTAWPIAWYGPIVKVGN